MSNYIDISGLDLRIGSQKVTDLCGRRFGADRTNYLTGVISRAEDYINGYAGNLYVTPLPDSGIIEEWSYRLAEYELYKNSPGNDIPVKYKNAYDEATKTIADMAKGIFIPPNGTIRKTTAGISSDFESDTEKFTEEKFWRF